MDNTELIELLEKRFSANMDRHPNHKWSDVVAKLLVNPKSVEVLLEMEQTGGEIDVVDLNNNIKEITFVDCSKETPLGRRNLCYDEDALIARKQNKPKGSALEMAKRMKVTILTVHEYQKLQIFETVDTKTSSWLLTDEKVRMLGGAFFGDNRYDYVFIYHNGADSYYAARGFRAKYTI